MNRLPYTWLKQTYKKEEEEKMKKLITILAVMIVLVGAAFATDAVLTLNSTIAKVEPAFTLGGTVVANAQAVPASYTSANTTINTGKNIATEDIYVAIAVFQNNKSFYKDDSGFDLTVTATKLVLDNKNNPAADEQTADPTVVAYTVGPAVKHGNNPEIIDFQSEEKTQSGNVAAWTVSYPSGKKIQGNEAYAQSAAKAGTAIFKWTHNEELLMGTYTGTITLTYTTN